jgi:AcrR family transcriptional regulator
VTVLTAKGAATRERIVRGTAELIRTRGVSVGLEDIRAATSTSKSQLFHYFPDGKAGLLLAVARHEAARVLDDQQPALGDLTTWAKWQTWRARVLEIYDGQRAGCPLSALVSQLATPGAREIVTDLYDCWHNYLVRGIRALESTGETSSTVDENHAATTILTAITGGANLLRATDSMDYLETALTDAVEALRRR